MTFLWLYGGALVVAVAAGLWLKRVTGARPERPLTFEEIGYLGGGPVRAAEVAVAGLVSDNRARVSGPTVTAVGPPEPSPADTPLRSLLLARLTEPRDLDRLLVAAATSGPARALGTGLVAGGLLVAPRRRLWRAVLSVLPLVALAAVAVVAGPGGWPAVTALIATGVVAVILLLGPPPVLTRNGARAYDQATEGLAPVDPAEITARYGLTRTVARPEPARRDRAETAVFDGEQAEPIEHHYASDEAPRPRRRGRAVIVEPQRWQRRNRWLVAGGWFAGGWLAAEWLEDGGGDFLDADFGGFDG